MTRRSVVLGSGSALPNRRVTNAQLAETVDTSDEWIVERTGIRSRYLAGEGETTGTLAFEAARRALEMAGIAAHVAVLGVGRPAPYQLRQDCGPSGERALQGVLEVEEAEVILAALADDDLLRSLFGIGEQFRPFAVELPLQRLGEGRNPHRAAGLLGPDRSWRKISERLADPGARFGEQQVG